MRADLRGYLREVGRECRGYSECRERHWSRSILRVILRTRKLPGGDVIMHFATATCSHLRYRGRCASASDFVNVSLLQPLLGAPDLASRRTEITAWYEPHANISGLTSPTLPAWLVCGTLRGGCGGLHDRSAPCLATPAVSGSCRVRLLSSVQPACRGARQVLLTMLLTNLTGPTSPL